MNTPTTNFNRPKRPPPLYQSQRPLYQSQREPGFIRYIEDALLDLMMLSVTVALWGVVLWAVLQLINQGY